MRRKHFTASWRVGGRSRTTVRLALANGMLAALLLLNLTWRAQPALPRASGQENAAPAQEIALTTPQRKVGQLVDFGETLQRPLFIATRRPAPVAVAKPKTPPKPQAPPRSNLAHVRLTGVVMMPGREFGLLSMPGQSELMRARAGITVKGWKVVSIAEDGMVLNNGEEDMRLDLWPRNQSINTAQTELQNGRPRMMTPAAGGQPQ